MEFRSQIHTIIGLVLFASVLHAQTPDTGSSASTGATQPTGLIQSIPLTANATYSVGISGNIPTTILLPKEPQAFEGMNLTKDVNIPGNVFIQHTPGTKWFTVYALMPEATANLNVLLDGKIISFFFHLSKNPHRSLTLFEPPARQRSVANSSAIRSAKTAKISVSRLLEILDDAKTYLAVKEQYPELYRSIQFFTPDNLGTPYNGFEVIIDQVFKFPSDDTIVFRVIFVNNDCNALYYDPQTIGVRVRNTAAVYWKSISDLDGFVPAARKLVLPDGKTKLLPGQTWGYFSITNNPDGTRANLAIENQFDVLVKRLDTQQPASPVSSPTLPISGPVASSEAPACTPAAQQSNAAPANLSTHPATHRK